MKSILILLLVLMLLAGCQTKVKEEPKEAEKMGKEFD